MCPLLGTCGSCIIIGSHLYSVGAAGNVSIFCSKFAESVQLHLGV